MRAVVLAAGLGERLGVESKPLAPLAGRALLLHVLDRLADGGVTEAVVVTGHRAAAVRSGVHAGRTKLELRFVEHDAFAGGNGLSLLAAANWVPSEGVILIMGDHLHAPETIASLVESPHRCTTLVIDARPDDCADLREATKVATCGDRLVAIGKDLRVFDAVDTGLFWILPDLLNALREARAETGDCTVTDGVARLALRRQVLVRGLTRPWLDMDTPADFVRAEGLLRRERSGKVRVR